MTCSLMVMLGPFSPFSILLLIILLMFGYVGVSAIIAFHKHQSIGIDLSCHVGTRGNLWAAERENRHIGHTESDTARPLFSIFHLLRGYQIQVSTRIQDMEHS